MSFLPLLQCVITQEKQVEVVGAEEYKAALCDPLAFAAPFMVQKWNAEHLDDIVRFCNYLTVSTLSPLPPAGREGRENTPMFGIEPLTFFISSLFSPLFDLLIVCLCCICRALRWRSLRA